MSEKAQKSWQARFSQSADALTEAYVESLSFDQRLWKYDIVGSIAHAEMLVEVGLISRSDCQAIKRGFHEIEEEIEAGRFKWDTSCEDIHMVMEGALIARIGEPGRGRFSPPPLWLTYGSYSAKSNPGLVSLVWQMRHVCSVTRRCTVG